MLNDKKPHPLNAPGPVFTGCDECISCGAPPIEAPDLMGVDDDNGTCYFRKQPQSAAEWYRAANASGTSCVGAIYCADPTASIKATGLSWDELIFDKRKSPRPANPESLCEKCKLPKFSADELLICMHCETGLSVETTMAVINYYSTSSDRIRDTVSWISLKAIVALLGRKSGLNIWFRSLIIKSRIFNLFRKKR